MRSKSILCKSLSTVESLGSVNLIASDKTGTLTQGNMELSDVAVGLVPHTAEEARQLFSKDGPQGGGIKALVALAALCNDAEFEGNSKAEEFEKNMDEPEKKADEPEKPRKINGDATGSSTGL